VEVAVPAGRHALRLAQVLLPEDLLGIAVTATAALGLALWFGRRSRLESAQPRV
jgi:hypothetical protein